MKPTARMHPRRLLRHALCALTLAVMLPLTGCATFEPSRPYAYTTEAEVIAARGEPTRRWHNDDTTTTLEYATQPDGDTCLMVQIDAGGIVLRQWDALDEENLARVRKGMSRDEVARLLGEHRAEQTFTQSGEVVWDWNVRSYGGQAGTLFNVHFIDGKVVRTSRTQLYARDPRAYPPWADPFGYPFDPFYDPYWPRQRVIVLPRPRR